MAGDNGAEQQMIGEYTEEYLLQRAREIVEERTGDWEITNLKAEEKVPRFHKDELDIGNVFGKGGFFVVSEVKKINLQEEEGKPQSPDKEEIDDDAFQAASQDRQFMAEHCIRNGTDCRYAFKIMQNACKDDPTTFVNTVVDLAIECRFLSSVRHPNIIKMRAMSTGDICASNSFLILDRLYDTLMDRIDQWKKKDEHTLKIFDFQGKKDNEFLATRLLVAYDVASALSYLHDLNIIYRDLKPNNVGFDVRGDAKLFDFGLATEFREEEIGSYKLTGDTGTIRYMAPEVALSQKYTETADVYSFGILLWQICKMELPYGSISDEMVERKAIHGGNRPKIDPKWPPSIRRLLQDCFASHPRRPQMEVVGSVLGHAIKKLAPNKKLVDEDDVMGTRHAMSVRQYTSKK